MHKMYEYFIKWRHYNGNNITCDTYDWYIWQLFFPSPWPQKNLLDVLYVKVQCYSWFNILVENLNFSHNSSILCLNFPSMQFLKSKTKLVETGFNLWNWFIHILKIRTLCHFFERHNFFIELREINFIPASTRLLLRIEPLYLSECQQKSRFSSFA